MPPERVHPRIAEGKDIGQRFRNIVLQKQDPIPPAWPIGPSGPSGPSFAPAPFLGFLMTIPCQESKHGTFFRERRDREKDPTDE